MLVYPSVLILNCTGGARNPERLAHHWILRRSDGV